MAEITKWVKKIWKNRTTEFPTRRTLMKEDGSSEIVTVTRNEGTVSEEGDAFDADTMNNLEERIDAGFAELNGKLHWNVASSWNDAINKAQNELQVLVRLSTGSQDTEYAFNISLPNNLSSRAYVRNRGYYQSSTSYSVVQISYNINTCICTTYNLSGVEYKNSTELVFLYR